MIRDADPADAAEITGVFATAWREGFEGLLPDDLLDVDIAETTQKFGDALDDGAEILVLELEHIDGFVWMRETDGAAELHMVYSRPESHAGMALVNEAIERLETRYESVILWSLDANERANAFYTNRGFEPDGATKIVEMKGYRLPHTCLRRPLTLLGEARRRPAARVIARDGGGAILLIEHHNERVRDESLWLLPGGKPEDKETLDQAARREFYEETGAELEDLGAPIFKRRHIWHMDGIPIEAVETFYRVGVDRFEPCPASLTDLEKDVVVSYRWWTPEELARTDELIVPAALRYPDLVDSKRLRWVGR